VSVYYSTGKKKNIVKILSRSKKEKSLHLLKIHPPSPIIKGDKKHYQGGRYDRSL
jgi:hypothetical protein